MGMKSQPGMSQNFLFFVQHTEVYNRSQYHQIPFHLPTITTKRSSQLSLEKNYNSTMAYNNSNSRFPTYIIERQDHHHNISSLTLSPTSSTVTSSNRRISFVYPSNHDNGGADPRADPPMLATESFDHSSSSSSSSVSSHSYEELAMYKNTVHPSSSRSPSRSRSYNYETSSNFSSIQKHSIPKKKGGGFKLIVPWSSSNLNNGGTSDDVHPLKKKMKKDRKTKTAAGTLGGMVVGGVILGPLGVFLGGAIGGVTTQKVAKHSDRKAQRKHEKQCYQKSANEKSKHWNTNGNALFV
jgi:hypothetical protein